MDRIEDAFAFLLKLCCAALKKLAIQFFFDFEKPEIFF
jgi:hypothetical protein